MQSVSGSVKLSPAALARDAFNWFDSHRLNIDTKIKIHPLGWIPILVEPRGIEPLYKNGKVIVALR